MAEVGMSWLLEARPDIRPDMSVNEGGGERFELTDGRTPGRRRGRREGHLPRPGHRASARPATAALPTLGDNAVPHLGEVIARIGRGLPDTGRAPARRPDAGGAARRRVRRRRRPARGAGRGRRPAPRAGALDARAGRDHDGADDARRLRQAQRPCPAGRGSSSTAGSCPAPPRPTSRRPSGEPAGRRPRLRADLARAAHPRQRLARPTGPSCRRSATWVAAEVPRRRAAAEPRHRVHRLVVPPGGGGHGGVRLLAVLHHPARGATSPGSTTPTSGCTSTTCTPRSASTSTSRRRCSHEGPRPRHPSSAPSSPASTTRSPTCPACGSGTRTVIEGDDVRTGVTVVVPARRQRVERPGLRGVPPPQRQRRDDRPALDRGGRPAALPRRRSPTPTASAWSATRWSRSRSRSCPTASRPGRCPSWPRPGTAPSTTSTAST